MRVVMDTNVIVSALIRPRGVSGALLFYALQGAYTVLYTEAILQEWIQVLQRPKIREKYGITEQDIHTIVAFFLVRGEYVEATTHLRVCRDSQDDKFLVAAIDGKADVIVSGDKDLLALSPFRGIPIVSPRQFLNLLERR